MVPPLPRDLVWTAQMWLTVKLAPTWQTCATDVAVCGKDEGLARRSVGNIGRSCHVSDLEC